MVGIIFRPVWRVIRWVLLLCLLLLVVVMLRRPLLRGSGDWLVQQDQPSDSVGVVFILSGRPAERGAEAVRLAKRFPRLTWICTGELQPDNTLALGLPHREADLTRLYLIQQGVDSSRIRLLPVGTSTREELRAIVQMARRKGWKRFAVLSSRLHTRRIQQELDRAVGSADGSLRWAVWGAPARLFRESTWWESEEGLLFVTNEYIKLVYYWLT